jgi:hypothetical protein
MSTHTRLLAALVLSGLSAAELDRSKHRTGSHRTQRLRRNHDNTNLYGVPLPAAYLRPEIVATLRTSKGSQAIHRIRKHGFDYMCAADMARELERREKETAA